MKQRPSLDEIFSQPAQKAPAARPTLDEIFSQPVKPKAEEPGFLTNVGRGAVDALKSRGLGIIQAGADALPDSIVSPDTKQLLRDEAALQQAKRKQGVKGVGGFIGQVAGDPLTYLPLPGGGSIAALAGKGAAMGAASGLTTPVAEGQSRALNTAIGAGIGGAGGAAIPAVTKGIAGASRMAGKAKRVAVGSTTRKEADKAALDYVSGKLKAEGVTPEILAQRAAEAKQAGLGATLPEYTQSSSLLGAQKQISNQTGKASNYLRNYFKNRNENVIPGRLREVAKPFQAKMEKASQSYNRIFTEGNVQVDTSPLDKAINDKLQTALPGGQTQTLFSNIKNLVDSAKTQGNTLQSLHNVKMEIDNLVKAAPTPGIKKVLKAETVGVLSQLRGIMDQASPDYAATRRLYEEGLPGNKILAAMEKSRVGSVADIRNKLFGTLEKQKELQRAMPPEEYRGVRLLARSLDDIVNGKMGGSDTAFNQKAQKELLDATGARGIDIATQPLNAAQKLASWYTEKVRQRDYEAIAKLFTDPDIAALGKALQKTPRGSSKQLDAVNTFAVRALANYSGKETQQ